MREYETTGTIRVNCGYIGLDKRQAKARTTRVKAVKDRQGIYDVTGPVEFKAGEKILLENPDKATLSRLLCLEKPEPEKVPELKKPAVKNRMEAGAVKKSGGEKADK